MKIVYGNYYSFTRLWCVVIWEIYLNFIVKISKKKTQLNGFVYFSVHVSLTQVLRRGLQQPPKQFLPWCSKSRSQGVKLIQVPSSSFFPLHFSEKNSNLPPTPGVG